MGKRQNVAELGGGVESNCAWRFARFLCTRGRERAERPQRLSHRERVRVRLSTLTVAVRTYNLLGNVREVLRMGNLKEFRPPHIPSPRHCRNTREEDEQTVIVNLSSVPQCRASQICDNWQRVLKYNCQGGSKLLLRHT